ncbi:MAG: hypothetical protein JNM60_11310 [Candidatus Competibacteraceae bacterium]|nr:hypothetical protein [Candidatus Competibacteraceae bacterium]
MAVASRPDQRGAAPEPAPSPKPDQARDKALANRFEKLLGRAASKEEIAELYRVQAALEIDDNDALWSLVMGLQSFRDSIAAAIDQRLSHADAVAESITAAAKAQFLKTLPEAIAKAAVAHKPKTVLGLPATYLPLAVLGLSLAGAGLGGWTAFEIGKNVGAAVALDRCARDQKPPPAPPPAVAPKKTQRP